MNNRDITKLQYEKGQRITADEVNARFVEAYNRFNFMAPTDTAPLTTGQFLVYEPRMGYEVRADFTIPPNADTTWKQTHPANGIVTALNSWTHNTDVVGEKYFQTVADGAGVEYSFLNAGVRYTIYYNISATNITLGTVKVGIYNADGDQSNIIIQASGAAPFSLEGQQTFIAKTGYLCLSSERTIIGAADMWDVTVNAPDGFPFEGLYLFDWDRNKWLIPNYCGFMHPATKDLEWGGRREVHALIAQAIKKEVDAANEVLSYL